MTLLTSTKEGSDDRSCTYLRQTDRRALSWRRQQRTVERRSPSGLGLHRVAVLLWSHFLRPAGTPNPLEITETHVLLLFSVVYALLSSASALRRLLIKESSAKAPISVTPHFQNHTL